VEQTALDGTAVGKGELELGTATALVKSSSLEAIVAGGAGIGVDCQGLAKQVEIHATITRKS
jgi:hypothetical protein